MMLCQKAAMEWPASVSIENQRARLYLSSIQEGPGIARLYAERGNQPVLIISKDDGIH